MRLPDDNRLCTGSHEKTGIFATIMQAFCALHRIAWTAPWTEERR